MKNNNLFYSHICAAAKNNSIGLKGKLPWHIPEDLKFFQEKTKGKALIMGRKTFESLGRPLPHRLNIVVTRQKNLPGLSPSFGLPGHSLSSGSSSSLSFPRKRESSQKNSALCAICPSLNLALDFCSHPEVVKKYGQEIFIIGGGEIYKQSLSFVQKIYLTRIHKNYEGDAFYPEIPKNLFQETKRKNRSADPSYSFITYERILSLP